MDLLQGLNKEQREAVMHTEGPLLILAGAGSGKTKVLTHRIAYLIQEKGVHPSQILAITFTNKAANEMKERVQQLVGEMTDSIWVSTFHSACVRILRRDIEKIGFNRNFVIFDTSDQETLIKDCLKQLNFSDKDFPPKMVLNMIGRAKDELIEPSEYMKMYEADFRMGRVAKIYRLYQDRLKQNNALDFDDIIMLTIKLFLDNPPVLKFYQNKFRYIHVDEYQDTNTAQYKLVHLLAKAHENLCVVGDDDQSIYGFRGANIRNILDFEKDFKKCKVIKLEQNYRSTQTILDAANSVIRNNPGRKGKNLWTDNGKGCLIQHFYAENEHDEAAFVANEIIRLRKNEDRKNSDIAVLYRMNAQSRVIEDALMKYGVPYSIFGGLRFYDRKEIKDIIAYLRLIQNPSDDIALKRIINVPKRGIGSATISTAEKIAAERNCSIMSVVSDSAGIPELQRASGKLLEFVSIIENLRAARDTESVSSLIKDLIERTGMVKSLEDEDTEEAYARIENIKEFITVAQDFEEQNEENNLEEFLAGISLVSDIDTMDEQKDNVFLMTLHSAKGLEFPVVFMVGMEEGVFPGYRAITEEDGIDEERRLCYVGITRAKEKLYITNTKSRKLFGNTTYNRKSRFIEEISPGLIQELGETRIQNNEGIKFSLFRGSKPISLEDIKKKNTEESFNIGDRVEHKKFGTGTVTLAKKEGDDLLLEIQFDSCGMKRLVAAYANLKKI